MNPLARRDDIYLETLAGETVLYDKGNHKAHCLNTTMATVWENADGTRTIDEIAQILERQLGIPNDGQVVLLALEQLEQAGLMEEVQAGKDRTDLPSRRQMARKLAMAGVSASLIPLVASVIAPTPAMAASASTRPHTVYSFEQQSATVGGDVVKNFSTFSQSEAAQSSLNAARNDGNQGIVETMQGNNALAQKSFQAAEADFDGVLKALGLGPL